MKLRQYEQDKQRFEAELPSLIAKQQEAEYAVRNEKVRVHNEKRARFLKSVLEKQKSRSDTYRRLIIDYLDRHTEIQQWYPKSAVP